MVGKYFDLSQDSEEEKQDGDSDVSTSAWYLTSEEQTQRAEAVESFESHMRRRIRESRQADTETVHDRRRADNETVDDAADDTEDNPE